MKQTAVACSNIAFIKFFGKKDEMLRIPMNSSISMNLKNATSTTTVEFSEEVHTDSINMTDREKERIVTHLDRIRKIAKISLKAKVVTENNFPKGSGIASSASGFAALTVAATKALDLNLSEKELGMLSRVASGSACRSIPTGFVKWEKGTKNDDSYAFSLYPPSYWNLKDVVVIVDRNQKPISTSKAHGLSCTSPFLSKRFEGMDEKIKECEGALAKKDFERLGELIESEALNMHAVMMTAHPSIFYFRPGSISVMETVWKLRKEGIQAYFTLDAGPTVHVIYEGKEEDRILPVLKKLESAKEIIVSEVGEGAKIIS